MKNVEYLAGVLYEAYCSAVGGKAFNGDQLPSWHVFSSDPQKLKQADGWREVARTSLDKLADGD